MNDSQIIEVLDHGHVRLVNHMGDDLSIVRAARVSHNAEWRTGEEASKDEKLIRYLLKNRHTSPFEHVVFTFDIKCPIFIARQWMRHRTWSFNEISARYSELPAEFYVPQSEHIGHQSSDNKQARDHRNNPHAFDIAGQINAWCSSSFKLYQHLLTLGTPRELARGVLPLNTYTHYFGTIDLHNLLHFIGLRLHPHAQWEIQQYAMAMLDLVRPIVPSTIAIAEMEGIINGHA